MAGKKQEQPMDGDWKKYHENMMPKMAVEKLREAMRTRDNAALNKSLEECQAYGLDDSNEDYAKGRKMLNITRARQNLKKAMDDKGLEAIYKEIDHIDDKKYGKYLQAEIADAHRMADILGRREKLQKLKKVVLDMDKKTMSEVRRYNKAPPILHKVMQGALLLLGEDEGTTSDWKNIQKLLNPQGHAGLNRKIMDFDSSNVHPDIAARSKQILQEINLKEIQGVSAGGSTFFVWAMGVVEETELNHSPESSQKTEDEPAKPASLSRQQEIFGRLPLKEQSRRTPYRPGKTKKGTPRQSEASPERHAQTASTSGVTSPRSSYTRESHN